MMRQHVYLRAVLRAATNVPIATYVMHRLKVDAIAEVEGEATHLLRRDQRFAVRPIEYVKVWRHDHDISVGSNGSMCINTPMAAGTRCRIADFTIPERMCASWSESAGSACT